MHPSLASLASAAWFRFKAKKREREEKDKTTANLGEDVDSWSIKFVWGKAFRIPAAIYTLSEDLTHEGFLHTGGPFDLDTADRNGTYPVEFCIELKGTFKISDAQTTELLDLLSPYMVDIQRHAIDVDINIHPNRALRRSGRGA